MRHKSRQNWLILAFIATLIGVSSFHVTMYIHDRRLPVFFPGKAGTSLTRAADPYHNYSQIEDGLWLGGFVTEPPPGTQAVLNLCESKDPYRTEVDRWEPIRDAAPAPSIEWLGRQVEFVESQRQAGHGIYIHCAGGVSRSGMVMAAYLMRREGWSREQAIGFLRSKRPGVSPNPAFMTLLSEWERSLKHAGPVIAATQP